MLLPRHHEQTRVCRPAGPGRQTLSGRLGTATARTLIAAVCTSATLTAGAAPVLAQPAQESTTQGSQERIHQTLASSTVEEAISAARSQTGTPYAWGGSGPNSFDCSGLVQWAFGQADVSLPRVTHDQVDQGTRISYENARRGDLLYWTDGGGYAYHVAIYLGEDRMIDAPHTGSTVGERNVTKQNLAGAVRL